MPAVTFFDTSSLSPVGCSLYRNPFWNVQGLAQQSSFHVERPDPADVRLRVLRKRMVKLSRIEFLVRTWVALLEPSVPINAWRHASQTLLSQMKLAPPPAANPLFQAATER